MISSHFISSADCAGDGTVIYVVHCCIFVLVSALRFYSCDLFHFSEVCLQATAKPQVELLVFTLKLSGRLLHLDIFHVR